MTSKLPQEKISKKIFKLYFKFVFLIKKFKKKNYENIYISVSYNFQSLTVQENQDVTFLMVVSNPMTHIL
jgi:hypothetical protein